MLSFFVGIFIGAFIGFFVLGLCAVSRCDNCEFHPTMGETIRKASDKN